jgi:hypothetical protein
LAHHCTCFRRFVDLARRAVGRPVRNLVAWNSARVTSNSAAARYGFRSPNVEEMNTVGFFLPFDGFTGVAPFQALQSPNKLGPLLCAWDYTPEGGVVVTLQFYSTVLLLNISFIFLPYRVVGCLAETGTPRPLKDPAIGRQAPCDHIFRRLLATDPLPQKQYCSRVRSHGECPADRGVFPSWIQSVPWLHLPSQYS